MSNNNDVCAITETCLLSQTSSALLHEISPDGLFQVFESTKSWEEGCGLDIVYRKYLEKYFEIESIIFKFLIF